MHNGSGQRQHNNGKKGQQHCKQNRKYYKKMDNQQTLSCKKMDGKQEHPCGKEVRKNYGPNRSNAAKRLEKNRRRNDRNAHRLQQWRTKIKIKFIYHI